MVSTSRLEMEKFNGTNFELWKLKMEDLLIDQDLWVVVSGTKPIGMKDEEWVVLERKERSLIRIFCLANSILLNVSEEKMQQLSGRSWGICIKLNPWLINFFMEKLFSLRMGDGDSVVEHLNAFNTIVTQLILVGVKMDEEDHCMTLLCSFPISWEVESF
jgi:hypothetical protein